MYKNGFPWKNIEINLAESKNVIKSKLYQKWHLNHHHIYQDGKVEKNKVCVKSLSLPKTDRKMMTRRKSGDMRRSSKENLKRDSLRKGSIRIDPKEREKAIKRLRRHSSKQSGSGLKFWKNNFWGNSWSKRIRSTKWPSVLSFRLHALWGYRYSYLGAHLAATFVFPQIKRCKNHPAFFIPSQLQ